MTLLPPPFAVMNPGLALAAPAAVPPVVTPPVIGVGTSAGGGVGATASTPNPALSALSESQIQSLAQQRVQAALDALRAPITSAQKQAQAASNANVGALRGLGGANMDFLSTIGQGLQGAYDTGARSMGSLAAGFSAATADRVQAALAANDAFVHSQVAGAGPSGQAPDPNSLRDTLFALGGYIPAGSLEAQGVAARQWGDTQPLIESIRTQQNVQAEQAREATEQHDYEQQLTDLAAKEPSMKNDIIDKLYQRELDKLQARLQTREADRADKQLAEDVRHNRVGEGQSATQIRQSGQQIAEQHRSDVVGEGLTKRGQTLTQQDNVRGDVTTRRGQDIAHAEAVAQQGEARRHDVVQEGIDQQQANTQTAAEKASERQIGAGIQHDKETIKLQQDQNRIAWAQLKVDKGKYQVSVQQAIINGQRIDASASRALGHLVDRNGVEIKDGNGDLIPVHSTATPADTRKQYRSAVGASKTLLPAPIKNPKVDSVTPGTYLAKPGARGKDVFVKPGFTTTTNNPNKAQTQSKYSFAEAQTYLMSRYGISRPRARQALVAAGWKPDGKRPRDVFARAGAGSSAASTPPADRGPRHP